MLGVLPARLASGTASGPYSQGSSGVQVPWGSGLEGDVVATAHTPRLAVSNWLHEILKRGHIGDYVGNHSRGY